MEEINKLYKKINSGVFSVYCKKSNKIFHVFHAPKNICLTSELKDGIPLQELPFLSFLSSLDKNVQRRVRKKDFILLVEIMRNKMNTVKAQYFLSILSNAILLNIQQASDNIAFFSSLNSTKKRIVQNEKEKFYFLLQTASGGNQNSKEDLKQLIKAVEKKSIYQNIRHILHSPFSEKEMNFAEGYLQGKSFKEMLFYRTILLGNKTNIQFSYFDKNLHSICFYHKIKKKKQPTTVIIVSSLSGKYLPNLLNVYKEISSLSSHVKRIIFIEGDYSVKEWQQKIQMTITKNPNALYIYQGHSEVKKGKIHWLAKDEFFPAPQKITNYLHLACTKIAIDEDLLVLPAQNNFLPIALLPDKNFKEELLTMFRLLNKNGNFLLSADQAFSNIRIDNLPAFIPIRCA